MKEPVFVIIPVHNRKLITLRCIESLKDNGDLGRYHIIIVDDGSTDGTDVAISELYPDVILLKGDGSLWWTGAISKGMNYAQQKGAEFFIWLNDDCITNSQTLRLLVEYSRKKPNTIVGAACYLSETNMLYPSGAKGRRRMMAKPSEVVHVDEMSGHCVCFPTQLIQQIGLPDIHRFPHYHGDSMYILRATRNGFSACILGDAQIYHSGELKSRIQDFLDRSEQNLSLHSAFKKLFLCKKSFYFLPTQFFYYTNKYGLIIGTPVFVVKLFLWLLQFLRIQFLTTKQ